MDAMDLNARHSQSYIYAILIHLHLHLILSFAIYSHDEHDTRIERII